MGNLDFGSQTLEEQKVESQSENIIGCCFLLVNIQRSAALAQRGKVCTSDHVLL